MVTVIDKSARKVTVKTPDGEKTEIQVPSDVKEFDKLKVGSKIDVDYTESIALAMAPKGTKPSEMERVATAPGGRGDSTVVVEVDKTHGLAPARSTARGEASVSDWRQADAGEPPDRPCDPTCSRTSIPARPGSPVAG